VPQLIYSKQLAFATAATMSFTRIHPILLIDLLIASDQQRARIEPHLRAIEHDPTSTVVVERTEQNLFLAAEDELQLEAVCDRLRQAASVEFGRLRVAYRETIRRSAQAEGKYIRQTGGAGNYGHCWLRLDPNEHGKGNSFVNEIANDAIPSIFVRSIEEGVLSAMTAGILAGHPMTDVRATLSDGSYHDSDSNEMAFKFAGSIAFKEAVRKAAPVLLEPVMAVEVAVDEQHLGKIVADINRRRGRIEKIETTEGWCEIEAIIPLAEVLRSSRGGRPAYSMRFAAYQEVPRPNDPGNGDIPVPSLRPRHPRPSGAFSSDAEPSE
jgi:elongation factor G